MELGGHLLTVLVFFPAFGALALLLLRGDDEIWIRSELRSSAIHVADAS